VFCGFGGATITGSSVLDCANAGVVGTSSSAVPRHQLFVVEGEEAVHARRRDGARGLRMWKITMMDSTANDQTVTRDCRYNLPFAPDAADFPTLATLRSTPPDAFAHDHGR
jgi:hypothetical protein